MKTLEQLQNEIEVLKKENTSLKNEDNNYKLIIENANEYIWKLNLVGEFTFINNYALEATTEKHINWQDLKFDSFIHPDDIDYANKIHGMVAAGKKMEYEIRVFNKFGKFTTLDVRAIPIIINNEIIGTLSFGKDITKNKIAEESLLLRENYLSALNQSKKMLLTASLSDGFDHFVNILGAASTASRTYIFINHTNNDDKLVMSQKAEYCATGIKPEIDNPLLQNLLYDDSFSRWYPKLSNDEIIDGKIVDFPQDEKEFFQEQDIKAVLIIPILINGEFIGFIGFDNCIDNKEWSKAEKVFLRSAANDLAQFIERHQTLEKLKIENLRFQSTMDALNAIVYVADIETHELIYQNKLCKNITENLIGNKCYSVLQHDNTDSTKFCTNHLLIDKNGKPNAPYVWEFNNTVNNKWYQCTDQAITWTDGRLVRLEIAIDITELKNNEEIIKKNLEHQQLISNISSKFVGDFNINESINYLLKSIGEYSNADRSYVFQFDDDIITMRNTHEWCAEGVTPEIDNLQNQPTNIFPWWMEKLKNNEFINIPDVSSLPPEAQQEKEILESQAIKSAIIIPLNVFGKLIGFMGFDNTNEAKQWHPETISVLSISAEILANTLHINNAEQNLKKQAHLLDLIFTHSPDSIVLLDKDFNYTKVSETYAKSCKIEASEFLGKNHFDLFPSDFKEECDAVKKGKYIYQKNARPFTFPKNPEWGVTYWDLGLVPILDESNEIEMFLFSLKNVTNIVEANKLLKESEEQYRILFDMLPYGGEVLDTAGNIVKCSPRTEKMLGYNIGELQGKNITELLTTESIKTFNTNFPEVLKGNPVVSDIQMVHKNASLIDILRVAQPITTNNGEITSILALNVDITSRKINENIIKQSQQKFKFLTETMTDVVTSISPLGILTYSSPSVTAFGGYIAEEEIGNHVSKYFANKLEFVKAFKILATVLINKKSGQFSFLYKAKNKKPFQVEFTYTPEVVNNRVVALHLILRDVSERIQYHTNLQKSEQKFKGLFDGMSAGVVFCKAVYDKNKKMTDCLFLDMNSVYEKYSGLEKSKAIGNKLSVMLPQTEPEWFSAFGKVVSTGKPMAFNMFQETNNKYYSVFAYKSAEDEFVAILDDITEREKSHQALQESQTRLKAFFEATYEGIVITENGIIIDVNDAICNMSGYSYNEFVGKHAPAFFPPETMEIAKNHMISGYTKPYDSLAIKKDGSLLHIEMQGRTFDFENKKVRVTAVRDISERKLYEIELKQHKEELEQHNSNLQSIVNNKLEEDRKKDRIMMVQSKQASMGEMIGNIAHQWRQPLNDVGAYIQNLEDKYEFNELNKEVMADMVKKTMDKIAYMSQTIDDFRNFFRSDKEKTKYSISKSIIKSVQLTEASFNYNNISIVLNLQNDITIKGYPNEFSQAILNVLNNAKDALIETKPDNPQVEISLIKVESKITIIISNNGGRIPEDKLAEIFNPYFSTKPMQTGTGLGLYISQTIIERNMDGRIFAQNIGNSAEFVIEFFD